VHPTADTREPFLALIMGVSWLTRRANHEWAMINTRREM
jgi:hypothetical protein